VVGGYHSRGFHAGLLALKVNSVPPFAGECQDII
jgi:hypothetical protein